MANDGKVVISTELDNSGIEKGLDKISGMLGGMKSILKEIADAVVTAFAFSRIVDFAVESSQAAMTLSDALNGLQSTLEGQGRSFSAAQAFIEEYTKDGLIPATNAITAYKNLAMRGYDDSQIQQVMQALKDASAYGRQASFTMGEAVESATEGLKNENSILVDNAGVTKNVAKMWEEYAASIGTTANNLTQQQKIQAEVTGILEESKYQAGDAATVAGTLSGQLQQLSFNFNNLKVAVGNAINPFVQTVLPIINSVIVAFVRLANAVATVVGILFGKATVQTAALAEQNNSVASSASAGAEAEKELADNTKAAGKAAKRALASFDELNILQFGSGSGSDSSAGVSTGTTSSGNAVAGIEVEDTVSPKLQAIADAVREAIGAFQQLGNLIAGEISFGEFIESLTPLQSAILSVAACISAIAVAALGMSAFNKISAFFKIIKDMKATSFIGKIAEVFILAASGSGTFSEKINQLGYAIKLVFGPGSVIMGIGTVVGGAVLAVTNFFSMLSNGFNWVNEALMLVGIAITAVGAIILGAPAVVTGVAAAIVAAVATAVVLIKEHWEEITAWFRKALTAIGQFFANLWQGIVEIWGSCAEWFNANVVQPMVGFFSELWKGISMAASTCWAAIVDFFTPAIEWFSKLFGSIEQTISDVFYNIGVLAEGCWAIICAVWQLASAFFSDLWAGISAVAVDAWDAIQTTLTDAVMWIGTNVVQPVGDFFAGLWNGFTEAASQAWEAVKEVFGKVASFFAEVFSDAWEGVVAVFSVAGEIFTDIKDGILTAFKEIVNGIIKGLNSAISKPFNGINTALNVIKGINILGLTPFADLRTISVPQIPYLAKGAVLPANKPFLAMVGDQRHGTNIEAPLSTIQEAVAIVMEDMIQSNIAGHEATVAILQEILEAILGIEIDGETISKAVERYNRKMAVVRGG